MIRSTLKRLITGSPLELPIRFSYDRVRRYPPDDRPAMAALRRILRRDSNCVDVGASTGMYLTTMVRLAPEGQHWAFEPLPPFHRDLVKCFGSLPNVRVLNCALSDAPSDGEPFLFVRSHPGHSGLRRRSYPSAAPQIETIRIPVRRLDDFLGQTRVAAIKVDVEGAELGVLRGAKTTLERSKPLLILEHGDAALGYGTKPTDVFDLLTACGLSIWKPNDWPRPDLVCDRERFASAFEANNYNWLASPLTG